MSIELRNFVKGETVRFSWNSNGADGASITRATNGTIYVYKDGVLTTEVTTGVTDTEDSDSLLGVHLVEIVTTDAFYTAGSDFEVVLKAASIDGKTVNATLARFAIQPPSSMKPVVGLAQGGAIGYVDLPTTASSTDGAYRGAMVRVKHATGALEVRLQGATAYVGATRRFFVDPDFGTAPDNAAEVELYLMPPTPAANVPDVNTKTIAAGAVTSIQTGLATGAALTAVADDVTTALAGISALVAGLSDVADDVTAILADTGTDLPATLALIRAKTDLLTLAAIGQEVFMTMTMNRGNKIDLDEGTSEQVAYDTDGTTEVGRVPFTRLSAGANPFLSVGG